MASPRGAFIEFVPSHHVAHPCAAQATHPTGDLRGGKSLKMPKLKTHKGMKKRFKISASGKVQHKRCGSSHLMSHKSGKRVRRLRKRSQLNIAAETARIRRAMHENENVNPAQAQAMKLAALAHKTAKGPDAGD
jgi:large subunit ribosomal protein L35